MMMTTDAAMDAIRQAEELLDLAERCLDERNEEEGRGTTGSAETEIVMIIDRSGSMEAIAADMEGGIRSFLRDQMAGEGKAFLTACLFDDRYEVQCVSEPLSESRISSINIDPRGSTALFDAIGRTLCQAIRNVPRSRLVVGLIITDGMENASCAFDGSSVNRLVDRCQKQLGWQFVFLGASEQQVRQAADLNIAKARAVQYPLSGPGLMRVMAVTSDKVSQYRFARSVGCMDFSDQERREIKATDESGLKNER